MKVIVDSNIIFSALLKKNSHLAEILMRETIDYIMPKYAYILIKGLNKKGFKKIFNYRDLTDDKEEVD
jgi:predicted nucleic acid-binding protein